MSDTLATDSFRDAGRPGDRALYLAALAVGLATAQLDDDAALAELTAAVAGRHGDAVAARRRIYASNLGSCENRRDAVRLLDIVCDQIRPHRRPRPT
jgi:hypothetical protein